jgi:hypothetical protein
MLSGHQLTIRNLHARMYSFVFQTYDILSFRNFLFLEASMYRECEVRAVFVIIPVITVATQCILDTLVRLFFCSH